MKEKIVENYLLKKVKERKGWCLKLLPSIVKGLPDRLVLLPKGVIRFVELKRPKGGGLSPSQEIVRDKLTALGFVWICLSTKESIDDFMGSVPDNFNDYGL